ncbi:hypothetical protein SAMN05216274_10466 [Cryobacterium levicorallinum]|uniref:Alpha/beta hydrolase family protein n=2 Tax=Cryobacterium levicorallinum TaxID=995038 RepID=A0ABY1EBL2_9MICO|nr:hypothetical protein SAMN05216274_10466 [Cryobacterium levicorallinum]
MDSSRLSSYSVSAVSTQNLALSDGRTLRVHDSADAHSQKDAFTVLGHRGSPQTGALLEPVLVAAAVRGIRLVSYGRPSYGGSTGCAGAPLPRPAPTWPNWPISSASSGSR